MPQLPGSWLAASGQFGRVLLWDFANPKRPKMFLTGQGGDLCSLVANSIRPLLAAGSESGVVYVWNSDSGLLLKALRLPFAAGAQDQKVAVAFSPDGKLLAGGNDSMVKVWDAADFTERWSAPTPAAGLTAFTPDGKTLVTASHFVAGAAPVVRRWRAEDGASQAAPLRLGKENSWVVWPAPRRQRVGCRQQPGSDCLLVRP